MMMMAKLKKIFGKKTTSEKKQQKKNSDIWYRKAEWLNEWMDASTLFNQTHTHCFLSFFFWLYYWYWSIIDWQLTSLISMIKCPCHWWIKCVWCSIQTLFILLFNSINNDRQWKKFNTNTHTHIWNVDKLFRSNQYIIIRSIYTNLLDF